MDVDALRGSPVGQLVPISGTDPRTGAHYDHHAFVPEPLPAVLDLLPETWNAAVEASAALSRLDQVCQLLPNPSLLITPALYREAVATSELEGTYGALPDVLESRLPLSTPETPEVREIRAYEHMAQVAFEWVRDRPITVGMLCDLQMILAKGSKDPPKDPGMVRAHQVIIGPKHCKVEEARFVPCPPDDRLRSGLDAWEDWVNREHDIPLVLQAALAHYQFEALHPFGDGNGRVGRLLIVLQLLRGSALSTPALTISPWLVKRRSAYQEQLLSVSRTGDWNPWIKFVCDAIREQCSAHVEVAGRLIQWMADLREKIRARRWVGVINDVAEELIEWPVLNARWIQDKYQVTPPTANSALNRLVEIGALRELTGRNYRRVYGAWEVMALVDNL